MSEKFYYATEFPRLDEGGLEYLEEWIQEHPNVRLIGIDTWAKIKPRSRRSTNWQYEEDYEAFTPLQELAAKYGVSLIVVHHMRKTESEDPLDMVLGSTANTGAVDGFLLLYRKRGETDARLYVTGRDIEEDQELFLTFNQECATWKIKGESENFARSPEQQALLDALLASNRPMTMKEIAATQPNKSYNTVRNLMVKLRNEQKVLLQNNTYTIVRRSQDSQSSQHSQRSQAEVLRAEDAFAEKVFDENTALTIPDYAHGETIVRFATWKNEPDEPLQNGYSPRLTMLTMPDYGNEETVVRPDTSSDEPVEPSHNGHSSHLTTLTIPDYSDEETDTNGHVPHLTMVTTPLNEKVANCPYLLTIAEDAHPLNIEKYQHHRRVVTAFGDGWVTYIGKDMLRVWLDGMLSSQVFKFYQALPVKEE